MTLKCKIKKKRRENRNGDDQNSESCPSYFEYMLQHHLALSFSLHSDPVPKHKTTIVFSRETAAEEEEEEESDFKKVEILDRESARVLAKTLVGVARVWSANRHLS